MSNSIVLFKIKRGWESFIDFFKDLFSGFGNFFKKIFYHPKTEVAGVKIRNARRRIVDNFKENKHNWNQRTFDDHGFRIEEEDT